MSAIENNSTRSSFFPKSDVKSKNIKSPVPSEINLKRNDPSRKAFLDKFSEKDAKVDIPEGIKDFSRIKKLVDSTPEPNNMDKIAQLKNAIKSGTYEVNYDGLADKLLASEF